MPLLADRVKETTTTTGTGTVTLAGAATGYRTFNSAFSNGNVVFYTIDNNAGEWEVGYGTVGTGTLTRSTVLESSNANALVSFSAGTKDVFCTAPATGLPADQTGNSGKYLTTNGTTTSWGTVSTGTVTSVSVTSGNGLAGTVTNPTTTPAIALSTTITGVLKGNGTAISAAVSGTDYAPATSGSSILYGNGAGGFSNVTVGTGLSFTTGTLSSTSTGLTNWTEAITTAAPNATVPVDSFTATGAAYTDIDAALIPKSTGALLAAIPDNATTGGNKRGARAVDLQLGRGAATQVASGSYSTIIGGYGNTVSGNYALACGNGNEASGARSVAMGNGNVVSSNDSIAFGASNSVSSGTTGFAVGGSNTVTGQGAAAIGVVHTANSLVGGVFAGWYGTTRAVSGKTVFPASRTPIAESPGIQQIAVQLLGKETTGATATTLVSDQSAASTTNQVVLPNNSAYYFKGSVIANVTGGGNTKAWTFEGAIKRGSGVATTAIVGTVATNVVAADSGASTWTISVTADTTNGALAVSVTGQAATTIRWVCQVQTTEVTF